MSRKTEKFFFAAILLLGISVRIIGFGQVPGGINQDEAFAAWEALNILKTGADSFGYRFPVYLTAWGSGMNALETYLMLPFVALFGLKTWAIRLPQLICAVMTMPAVYSIMKRVGGEKAALLSMLLLAVCPWHILLSRWGLESNLAPAFLSFGLCFFMKGLDKPRFLMLSALFYGLSLYAYATLWPVLPLMLLLQVIYCAACGRLRLCRSSVGACAVLLLLAAPLLAFVAVNLGSIDEIRTGFISVPKLLYMRAGEVSFNNVPENAANLLSILLTQSDGLVWNSAGSFGTVYIISMPFALVGLVLALVSVIRSAKEKRFAPEAMLVIWLLCALGVGLVIRVNINRINLLFIPLVLFTAIGAAGIGGAIGKRGAALIAAIYLAFFAAFAGYYFGDYADAISASFGSGLDRALCEVADEETVCVSAHISYPKVLFYTSYPVQTYADTVEYTNYPSAFLSVKSFEGFEFIKSVSEAEGRPVILSRYDELSTYTAAGYTVTCYGSTFLALPGE